MNSHWSRRNFLRQTAVGAGAAALAPALGSSAMAAEQARERAGNPRFLIVLCGTGGASMADSFMAMPESLAKTPATVNAYQDSRVQKIGAFTAIDTKAKRVGSIPAPFTAVQSDFVKAHQQDMMVVTHTCTSVNHGIAQQRSINGNAAWYGRTLQEAVALTYGKDYIIPNVHLLNGTGYTERGSDSSLPNYAFGERAPSPNLWPLALDGWKGVKDAPSRELFERFRQLRNDQLDAGSSFARGFGSSSRIKHWNEIRRGPLHGVEAANLITKMMVYPDSPDMPLNAYRLMSSDMGAKVRQAFPKYDFDPLEAQAALAFLLIRYGVSVTVTLGPESGSVYSKGLDQSKGGFKEGDMLNTPIAFDFSHSANRDVQALMWGRTLKVADKLISLLKSEEFSDGKSYWDHSMIYFASEFGRTRKRPDNSESFGTGHDLNNGSLIVSPLVNGGKVLGGVDQESLMTYGFDPQTGAPETGRTMSESEIYAGIAHALGVDTAGSSLKDMRAMRRTA